MWILKFIPNIKVKRPLRSLLVSELENFIALNWTPK